MGETRRDGAAGSRLVAYLTLLIPVAVGLGTWWYGSTSGDTGEAWDNAWYTAWGLAINAVGCFLSGYLAPRTSLFAGGAVMLPGVVWFLVELVTRERGEDATLWPVGLLVFALLAIALTVPALVGAALRLRHAQR